MDARFGPHTAAIDAGLARLRACRWLQPDDAEMETLTPAALDWLQDRADEHAAALLPFAPGLATPTVETVRSMPRAADLWYEAWENGRYGPTHACEQGPPWLDHIFDPAGDPETAHVRALHAAFHAAWSRFRLENDSYLILESRLGGALVEGAQVALAASQAWLASVAPRWTFMPPGEAVARVQLLWLAAFGDDPQHPSPWRPLFALWERGTWPMLLPKNRLVVYVPVFQRQEVVPDPERPALRSFPRRRPVPALGSQPLPPLALLGAGPAPGSYAGLLAPTSPELPRELRYPSPPPEMMALAGAPMPVSVTAPTSWYKRLRGRP